MGRRGRLYPFSSTVHRATLPRLIAIHAYMVAANLMATLRLSLSRLRTFCRIAACWASPVLPSIPLANALFSASCLRSTCLSGITIPRTYCSTIPLLHKGLRRRRLFQHVSRKHRMVCARTRVVTPGKRYLLCSAPVSLCRHFCRLFNAVGDAVTSPLVSGLTLWFHTGRTTYARPVALAQ